MSLILRPCAPAIKSPIQALLLQLRHARGRRNVLRRPPLRFSILPRLSLLRLALLFPLAISLVAFAPAAGLTITFALTFVLPVAMCTSCVALDLIGNSLSLPSFFLRYPRNIQRRGIVAYKVTLIHLSNYMFNIWVVFTTVINASVVPILALCWVWSRRVAIIVSRLCWSYWSLLLS